MKRVFGTAEAIFDIFYLISALVIGLTLIISAGNNYMRTLAGTMSLILVAGDSFHLVPRIIVIKTGKENQLRKVLGRGKQITSITMAIFYFLLWQLALLAFNPENIEIWSYIVFILAIIRIIICLLPHNKWTERYPPVTWGIWRNIPFFFMGIIITGLFFIYRNTNSGLSSTWLAIALSFLFYLPVVLWANKYPKIGMLMLAKICMYIWLLATCLSL